MATSSVEVVELILTQGGPAYRLSRRLGLEHADRPRRFHKALLLIVVTWVPLLLLSFLEGHALGGEVAVPLLRDPVVYSRFLFVVPLLVLAQVVVERSLRAQARYFLESGIVPEHEAAKCEAAKRDVLRMSDSAVAEGLFIALALVVSIVTRVVLRIGWGESTWERSGTSTTLAGWWYALISLPILFFLLFRWLWVFVLWASFLFRISRIDLELTPTHPDRAGGLGFLGWGLICFALVLMAVSAVMSGGFAYEIIHRGSSLANLKYHVIVFVVLAILILHAPLLVFTPRLARCRIRGLLDFGTLIGSHDRAFDEKWVKSEATNRASLLGNPDVQSLGGIAQVYEHVDRMQLIPFDKKAMVVLLVSALIPMVPLLGTSVALSEIMSMLGKIMM
jgi:hypothetical protein